VTSFTLREKSKLFNQKLVLSRLWKASYSSELCN